MAKKVNSMEKLVITGALNDGGGATLRAMSNGATLQIRRFTGAVSCGGSEHMCSRATLDALKALGLITLSVDTDAAHVRFTSTKKGREFFAGWDKANPVAKHVPEKVADPRFGVVRRA